MIINMTEDESWNEKFCSTCLILKPVGTKHCRYFFLNVCLFLIFSVCNRCVLQFDHHCPWVNNCVGVSNHKLFLFYLLSLQFSTILLFVGCLYCKLFFVYLKIYNKCLKIGVMFAVKFLL